MNWRTLLSKRWLIGLSVVCVFIIAVAISISGEDQNLIRKKPSERVIGFWKNNDTQTPVYIAVQDDRIVIDRAFLVGPMAIVGVGDSETRFAFAYRPDIRDVSKAFGIGWFINEKNPNEIIIEDLGVYWHNGKKFTRVTKQEYDDSLGWQLELDRLEGYWHCHFPLRGRIPQNDLDALLLYISPKNGNLRNIVVRKKTYVYPNDVYTLNDGDDYIFYDRKSDEIIFALTTSKQFSGKTASGLDRYEPKLYFMDAKANERYLFALIKNDVGGVLLKDFLEGRCDTQKSFYDRLDELNEMFGKD